MKMQAYLFRRGFIILIMTIMIIQKKIGNIPFNLVINEGKPCDI